MNNLDEKIKNMVPNIRYLDDMRDVLYDQEWSQTSENTELYYMYRGVEEKNGLRHDIIVIPGIMLGKEFIKTKGHCHIGKYQEIYSVLEGEAIFLMQKQNNNNIEDVYFVRVKKGQSIILPSIYDHVTINPSAETLKLENWISKECKSDYECIGKKHGACYYFTNEGWIKNQNYGNVPEIASKEPLEQVPDNLDFLYEN